jgi:hypothetical protein
VTIEINDFLYKNENEGFIGIENDQCVNSVIDRIRKAATDADSFIEETDSIVKIGFIYGGKVSKGAPHEFIHSYRALYAMRKLTGSNNSTFTFTPNKDVASYWWGEAYYSTKFQRRVIMHLHAVDKLYASDCPDIINNIRHVKGTVTDKDGTPIANASVGIDRRDVTYTDSVGRFELWLPFQDAKIEVNKKNLQSSKNILPTDTAVIIRLKPLGLIKQIDPIDIKGRLR